MPPSNSVADSTKRPVPQHVCVYKQSEDICFYRPAKVRLNLFGLYPVLGVNIQLLEKKNSEYFEIRIRQHWFHNIT